MVLVLGVARTVGNVCSVFGKPSTTLGSISSFVAISVVHLNLWRSPVFRPAFKGEPLPPLEALADRLRALGLPLTNSSRLGACCRQWKPCNLLVRNTPRPHLHIRFWLNEKPKQYRERVLKQIAKHPQCIPFGPHPRTPNWDITHITCNLSEQANINALHTFIIDGIETELADACDIPNEERAPYLGRGQVPKFVWRHAGGAPCGNHPVSSRIGRSWRLGQRRAEDLSWECQRLNFSNINQ